jgi:WD40 repeat protein
VLPAGNTLRVWDAATGRERRSGAANGFPHVFWPDAGDLLNTGGLWGLDTKIVSHAFSPGARLLATGHRDGTVRLWDPATGKVRHLTAGAVVSSLAFSPDGRLLASGHTDRTVRLWDPVGAKEVHRLAGHRGWVTALAFSPDGRRLASGGGPSLAWDGVERTFRDWLRYCRSRRKEPDNLSVEEAVSALTAMGNFLETVEKSLDRAVRLWDVPTGRLLHRLPGHDGGGLLVGFVGDGQQLLTRLSGREWSANRDERFRLWDISSGRAVRDCKIARPFLREVHLLPGRRILLLVGKKSYRVSTVRLLDLDTGKFADRLQGDREDLSAVAVSADGKTVALAQDKIRLYATKTGKLLRELSGLAPDLKAVALSPDARMLAEAGGGPCLFIREVSTGRQVVPIAAHRQAIRFIRFRRDGKTVVTAGIDRTARLWDRSSGKLLQQFDLGDTVAPLCFDLSPDGRILAAEAVPLTLWDVATGKNVGEWKEHGRIGVFRFSPDGRRLLVVGRLATLWDLRGKRRIRRLPGRPFGHHTLCRGGHAVAAAGENLRYIAVWEAETGNLLYELKCATTRPGWKDPDFREVDSPALAVSPDDSQVALGAATGCDHAVEVRDLATGRLLCRLEGHGGDVTDVDFSRDGRFLATASADSTALVWDLAACIRKHQGRRPALPKREVERLWTDLGSADEAAAYWAVDRLAEVPGQAVPLLRRRLRPVSAEGIARLVADLRSPEYARRQRAAAELARREHAAAPALRQALAARPPLELRRQAEALLKKLDEPAASPEVRRGWRCVAVLARAGTPEARAALQALARGAPEALLTREARSALDRLRKQEPATP